MEELATLWHFPGQILKVPTLERIESKKHLRPIYLFKLWNFSKKFFHFLFILIFILGLIHFFFLMPPNDFKGDTIINIKEGASLRSISKI